MTPELLADELVPLATVTFVGSLQTATGRETHGSQRGLRWTSPLLTRTDFRSVIAKAQVTEENERRAGSRPPDAPRHLQLSNQEGDTAMFPHVPSSGNTPTPWTDEVRRQAWIAVRIAAMCHDDERVLAYYLRSALAHGLTLDEVCYAGNLSPEIVRRLTRPAVL